MKKVQRYGKTEKRNFKWIYAFLLPAMIIFIMFYVQPIITIFVTSFMKWDGFNPPDFIGIRNYLRLMTHSASLASIKNLLLWSLIAMVFHVGFGVIVALVLYMKPRGWKFTRMVFMIPNIISAAAWALIYRFIFNDKMGILNAVIRIWNPEFSVPWFYQSPYAFFAVTFTWLFYAVIVSLIVLNDLMAIPKELIEASKLDGASTWQRIWHIDLPLCRISIGTAMLCSITSRISMFESIALTTGGGPGDDTMSLSVLLVRSITDYNYGFANAIGVSMFLLGMLVLFLVTKIFRMNDSVY